MKICNFFSSYLKITLCIVFRIQLAITCIPLVKRYYIYTSIYHDMKLTCEKFDYRNFIYLLSIKEFANVIIYFFIIASTKRQIKLEKYERGLILYMLSLVRACRGLINSGKKFFRNLLYLEGNREERNENTYSVSMPINDSCGAPNITRTIRMINVRRDTCIAASDHPFEQYLH